eukprot:3189995-Prymnesium_polylepis.1
MYSAREEKRETRVSSSSAPRAFAKRRVMPDSDCRSDQSSLWHQAHAQFGVLRNFDPRARNAVLVCICARAWGGSVEPPSSGRGH